MKYLIVFLILNLNCFGQTHNDQISFRDKIEAENFANQDIKNKNIFIYLNGGIAPFIFKTDKAFEEKYHIKFNEEGCTGSEYSIYYNFVIFDYLRSTFGKEWIKEIRKDALGFKEWKRNKNKHKK